MSRGSDHGRVFRLTVVPEFIHMHSAFDQCRVNEPRYPLTCRAPGGVWNSRVEFKQVAIVVFPEGCRDCLCSTRGRVPSHEASVLNLSAVCP